jgi:hypothetical protein
MSRRAARAYHPHFKLRPLYYLYSRLYEDARYPHHYRLFVVGFPAVTGRNGLMESADRRGSLSGREDAWTLGNRHAKLSGLISTLVSFTLAALLQQ